jgi:Ca2+-binding EF-hand superfamily protein
MKKKTMIAALVVATAAAGFTVARADQGDDKGSGGRHGRRGPDQAQLLEKFDANHNGVLDPEEKAAAKAEWEAHRKEREAKMLERFDANHNGTIDPEERQAMQAQREARRAEMLKNYDTDGDGKLSDSEREALRKDMREHHQERENR